MTPTATNNGTKPTATAAGYKPGEADMHALTWQGKRDVRIANVPRPTITDPTDIIVRATGVTVCGSDLHLYYGDVPDVHEGEILGHEGVGVVDQVGAQVTKFKQGDRVVASFSVACGSCDYCKKEEFTMCDRTNRSSRMEQLHGSKIGGILGYSHLLGGYAGTQAEYFRVPFGDVNLFRIPDEVPDEKAILLADVALAAYHIVVDIDFKEGETAAIWGAGAIGQLIAQWLCKVFGARKVIIIDNVAPRLSWVKDRLNVETINFDHTANVADEILSRLPGGVDVAFDAAGFRYSKSFLHRAMQTLSLETDTPETLNEAIRATRKRGRISVIADYAGHCSGFLIGALMEKGITLKGNGQAPVQKYMEKVLKHFVATGKFDPTLILTHRFALDDVAKAYRAFDQKRTDDSTGLPYIKAFVETKYSKPRAEGTPELGHVPGA